MAAEPSRRWLRRGVALLGLALAMVLATTWLASSETVVHTLGSPAELLIINDAGPVRVRALGSYDGDAADLEVGGVVVRSSQSSLLFGPEAEVLTEGGSAAFRVMCPNRFPCRASIEVFVPPSVALSIVAANDMVQIDSFGGAMSIFAGDGGVVLGAVTGSVSISSDGPVLGTSLGPGELTVDVVDDGVSLAYIDPPIILAVMGGNGEVSVELPPNEDYSIDAQGAQVSVGLASDPDAERLVSVRSTGAVSVQPTGGDADAQVTE